MHILLAHDSTSAADHAARLLEHLAPLLGARVTVLGMHSRWRTGRRPSTNVHELARAFRARGLPTEVETVEGPGASFIFNRLAEGDVDLVVLGGQRRGVLSRLRGSTARVVVRRSPVPTLVVGDAPVAVHHVLVCTSLQMPHGTAALRPAVAIAAATHAEVEVLHVMSQLPHTGGRANTSSEASERRRDEHDAARDHNLDETTTVFVERGLEARGRIRHGLVVDEIIAEARRLPADLVVLGAHGRPGPVSNLLTNITEHVVDELARPVLVVREPAASDT